MAVRALGLVLVFTFVSVILGVPTILPGLSEPAVNIHEERTISTELQPPSPPPLDEKEHHATIYIINLYAIKNASGNASEDLFHNEVVETLPDIMEPLVSVLLVIEDGEELDTQPPVNLDEFAQALEGQGFKVDKIDLDSKAKVLKMKLEKAEAKNVIDSALQDNGRKYRQKRTLCLKCGGGGGGWGGGGWGGHRGHHHHGGGGGRGCYRCGGGGGYGGGGSFSHASASASSGSWGKK